MIMISYEETKNPNIVKRLPDNAFLHIDNTEYQEWLATGNIPDPVPTDTPIAAQNSFIQGVKTALGGIIATNELASSYPLLYPAIQNGAWADVEALIKDAKQKGVITIQQYDSIKTVSINCNLPITL